MRPGRVAAAAILAVTLALAVALLASDSWDGKNKPVEAEQRAWFVDPAELSVMTVPRPAREEELVAVAPAAQYTYPAATLGELAPVGPVLGRPVSVSSPGAAAADETVVGELMPVLSSQPQVPSQQLQTFSDQNDVLLRELQQELEERRNMADMMSVHKLAQRRRESGHTIKRIESKLTELQEKEKSDDTKIDEDRGKISLLHSELSKAQASESAKESQAFKIAQEEEKINTLRKKLEDQEKLEKESATNKKGELGKHPEAEAAQRKAAKDASESSKSVGNTGTAPSPSASLANADKKTEQQSSEKETAALSESNSPPDASLVDMIQANKAAITTLTDDFKRLRLVTHGEYGILYNRLESIGSQLGNGRSNPGADRSLVLRAQAAVRQGRQIVQRQVLTNSCVSSVCFA
jgi:hypothetical protein